MGDQVTEAVKGGLFEAVQAALMIGGDVNARDEEGWTALTLAAADGRLDLVELLLIEAEVDVNYPNQWGETALSRAVFGGHLGLAKLLLDRGAGINLADEDGDAPLHVAAIYGNVEMTSMLLERKADVELRNKKGLTALETARRYGQKKVVDALENYRSNGISMWRTVQGVGGWVSYLVGRAVVGEPEGEAALEGGQAEKETTKRDSSELKERGSGMEEEHVVTEKVLSRGTEAEQSVATLLPELLDLCAGMEETLDICEDMLERLRRVEMLLDEKEVPTRVRASFQLITTRFHAFLVQHTKQTSVERLASTRTILRLLRDFHCDIDEVIAQVAPTDDVSILSNWKENWDEAVLAVENRLIISWEQNSSELSRELPDTTSQTSALLLLNSETIRHRPRYSARSQELLESASKKIARMSGAPVPEIPQWFVPRHEVQRHARPFASGSYGKVYRGIWRGSKVVIKCMAVRSSIEKKAFLREAKIWHKARHPHIVNFFGACHNCHPCFFICEEAANGNLVDYLYKRKKEGRSLVWSKLHEAALGLEYLHQNDIVHGDLKCNQILVTGEGVAKLTDFGFSFVLSESKPQGSGGATRWRAPECLGYKGQMPTFESDIYSFGMCVVEAVTYDVPWGVYLPDAAVMDHLRHRQFISRPKEFTVDAEWDFVLALCAFEPSKRIKLVDAIRQLERFAEGVTVSCSFSLSRPMQGRRFSKKDSLELLEENYAEQPRESQVNVGNAVLTLTTRRRYLCFRRAVLTIQAVFRYKKQLLQHRKLALRRACAAKIAGFIMMIYQRKKFLQFVSLVRMIQCRYRYRCKIRAHAEELRQKQEAEEKDRQYRTQAETESTQSSSVAGNAASHATDSRHYPGTSRSPVNGLQWVNDEDRLCCCICGKDFTLFRRRHHCRVCFEIICNDCSLTRRRMRVCVACAGLRSRGDPLSSMTRTQTQNHRRGRFLESAGGFFTGIGSRFTNRTPAEETMAYSADETDTAWRAPTQSSDLSLDGQTGLWEDDEITAARIPRHAVAMEKLISRGAYGEVHLGTWNGMQVAVKTLLPESRKRLRDINDFLAEARMISRMEHPCIVNLIGVAWDTLTDICMVMEYMDGGDLRSLLYDYEERQHPVGFSAEKLSIALNVAHALTYLHSLVPPVLHRDLKSRNILLNRNLEAKVTDFGVSRQYASQTMTAGVGTSLWMAPEVIMGERYDDKADIFSFGIVLAELDTHAVPYATASASMPPVRVMQAVVTGALRVEFSETGPGSVVALGNACIALDPADRPTAAEAMYRLHSALRELS